jgi:hypothetical protein
VEHQVETPVTGDLVTFTAPSLPGPQVSRITLRFLDSLTSLAFSTRPAC